MKIKEDICLEVDFSKEEKTVVISTDNSSGAEYECETFEDLKNAIINYINAYIELVKED